MNEPTNPFAAPQSAPFELNKLIPKEKVVPAGQGLRFANLIIDQIAQYAISFVVGIFVVVIAGDAGVAFLERTPSMILGIPIVLSYYILLEGTTGRSLGKLITGTKVVSEDGGQPTFGQIVGRSFARLIPFEPFSFLGKPARGWHDSMPKTYVVKVQ